MKKSSISNKKSKPLAIGFCGDTLHYDIPLYMFRAVKEATEKHNMSMYYFACEPLKSYFEYRIQSNILYDLIDKTNVDGIIIASNIVGQFVKPEELAVLCNKYLPLPIVSVGMHVKGIPSVVSANAQGMHAAVTHLAEIHGYEKIGFIRGPRDHPNARERYDAFMQALSDLGLELDKELVFPGTFRTGSGSKAIKTLIDERKKRPGRDIQAIVAVNDYTALGAIIELRNRNIRTPEEIAVIGVDDVSQGRYFSPSLSTVRQSFFEMAGKATELLISKLNGEKVPDILKIQSTYIARRSCGCPANESNETEHNIRLQKEVETALHSEPRKFLQYLSEEIFTASPPRKDFAIWDQTLTILRHPEKWNWGKSVAGKVNNYGTMAWKELSKAVYLVFQNYIDIRKTIRIGKELISTLDIPELMNILFKNLSLFEIESCYVVLYENPPAYSVPQKIPEWSRLILAFDKSGRMSIPAEGIRYLTKQLLPKEISGNNKTRKLVIQDLYFREEQQIGFWLLDANIKDEKVYSILNKQLSSSLQGALLLNRLRERTLEVANANNEIRTLNEQLKDENLRISMEMDVARHIQKALLPENIQTIHPDFHIAANMLTAAEVGGDYYDISLDKDGKLWLGIGDVSGHGVTSGLIMMMAQTIHTTITTNYNVQAREMIIIINKVLYKNVHGRMNENRYMTFTTFKYLGNGWFQYAGAHLDILIYRKHKKSCDQIQTKGTWLNLKPNIENKTKNSRFQLNTGDILILFTDGLTEVFNKEKKILDVDGFKQIVISHTEEEMEHMLDAIFNDVKSWCEGEPADDMSLLLLQRIR